MHRPPNGIYNWACVLHSAVQILETAARIRACQVARTPLRRLEPGVETVKQEAAKRRGAVVPSAVNPAEGAETVC